MPGKPGGAPYRFKSYPTISGLLPNYCQKLDITVEYVVKTGLCLVILEVQLLKLRYFSSMLNSLWEASNTPVVKIAINLILLLSSF